MGQARIDMGCWEGNHIYEYGR